MMKKLLLSSCLLLISTASLWAVEISGRLIGYNGELVLVQAGRKIDTLQVNNDGSFIYQQTLEAPYTQVGFFRFGKTSIVMMLNNNDKVQLVATKDADDLVTVKFSGDRAALNHYLTEYQRQNRHEIWSMEKLASIPFKQHAAEVDKMHKGLLQLLNKAGKEDSKVIAKLKETLDSDMWSLKQRYCWAVRAINNEPMDKDSDYVKFVRSLNMNDEARFEREKERGDMYGYLGAIESRIRWEAALINDPREKSGLSYVVFFELLPRYITSEKIRNHLAGIRMKNYFGMGGSPRIDEIVAAFHALNTDPDMRDFVTQKHKEMAELATGKPAPDFPMRDINGKEIRLSDLKGKVLYIDVWATWCGPCVGEIPYVEKLHQEYKDNPNIEFVSISVDHNVTAWKKKLEEDQPEWKQYIVDNNLKSELAKKYGINGIPRFLLIDKDGTIIDANATRPSSEGIRQILNMYIE